MSLVIHFRGGEDLHVGTLRFTFTPAHLTAPDGRRIPLTDTPVVVCPGVQIAVGEAATSGSTRLIIDARAGMLIRRVPAGGAA